MKVYVCFPEGKAKALTMSYDDGKIQDERLVSIFNHYGRTDYFPGRFDSPREQSNFATKLLYKKSPFR